MEALHVSPPQAAAEPEAQETCLSMLGPRPKPPAAPAIESSGELLHSMHPLTGMGGLVESTVVALVAQKQRPLGNWHRALGISARDVDLYARSSELRQFRLLLLEPQAVSGELLRNLFRKHLLHQLLQTPDMAKLGQIWRMLEKLPDSGPLADDLEGLAELQESAGQLLERLRDCPALLEAAADGAEPTEPLA